MGDRPNGHLVRWGRRREPAADAPDTTDAAPATDGHPFAPVNAAPVAAPAADVAGADDALAVAVEDAPQTGGRDGDDAPAKIADEPAADRTGDESGRDAGTSATPARTSIPVMAKRAGRNLRIASVTGILLGVGALAAAWWHPLAFAVTIYAFCVAAVIEWRNALARHGMHVSLAPVLMATAGMGVATWFGRGEGLVVALLVASAGVVAWRIVDDRVENTLADSLLGILTLMWIPFLGSFMLLMELADDGWRRIVILIVAVVLNDTFALFTGMLFGRRKLAPRVSPKKTWEGAIGGGVVGVAGATIAAILLLDGRWWVGLAVGAAAVVAAVLGDLAESALKRDIAIKDMSTALPGHGGFLDRLDSMLPAAAAAYVVFGLLLGTR